ncbi:MAG: hypothetical protein GVY22_01095 [Gammaproteobacteria bacterium]|jgi:hypothetical protein|nr:hypothetical protein [Gammaproteobacteria bacterium]
MALEKALAELQGRDQTAWSVIHYCLDVLAGAVDGNRIPEANLIIALDRLSAATDTRERAIAKAGTK